MLARYARNRDPRVIVGAGIGLDAAALDAGGQYVMALCSVKVGLRGESVTLPKLRYESTTSVEQALLTRRSESQKT
jgi:hypothetical protein